jgi:short-subunit dehydrogenase
MFLEIMGLLGAILSVLDPNTTKSLVGQECSWCSRTIGISVTIISFTILFLRQMSTKKFTTSDPKKSAVFVTGCSSGLGLDFVCRLADSGFTVYATVRKIADMNLPEFQVKRKGAIVPVVCDVCDRNALEKARDTVKKDMSDRGVHLASIVNNAGIGHAGMMEFTPLDDLRRVFEVNVVGAVSCTQVLLPLMRERPKETGSGRVLFIGSAAGFVVGPMLGCYSASKFGVEAVADAFRLELDSLDISVSLVEPGELLNV